MRPLFYTLRHTICITYLARARVRACTCVRACALGAGASVRVRVRAHVRACVCVRCAFPSPAHQAHLVCRSAQWHRVGIARADRVVILGSSRWGLAPDAEPGKPAATTPAHRAGCETGALRLAILRDPASVSVS